MFLLATLSMREKSATTDEIAHLPAGYSYLKTLDYRMNPEHPPLLKMISAVPLLFLNLSFSTDKLYWKQAKEWDFGKDFIYFNRIKWDKILFMGRLPMVILSMLLGLCVFLWAKRLYGVQAGLFALFLCAFSPNILAHSRLVTTDFGVTLFMFMTLYFYWEFLNKPTKKYLILTGMALGLSLASKFTAVLLFPVLFILWVLKGPKTKGFISLLIIYLLGGLVLCLSYGFIHIRNYHYGFVNVQKVVSAGSWSGYLLGKYSDKGWRHYFIIAFLIKTPIPMILFLIFTLIRRGTDYYRGIIKKERGGRYINEAFLLIPGIMVFIPASLSHKQIGLRYILPLYPFLFVWVSQLLKTPESQGRKKSQHIRKPAVYLNPAILILALWYLIGSIRIFPHYLAYFNELVGGPKNGYKYLADSNLDWGQDVKLLKQYMDNENIEEIIFSSFGTALPEYYGITHQDLLSTIQDRKEEHKYMLTDHTREIIAMSINNLQCLFYDNKMLFDWLKEMEPIKKIGYTIFLYDITGNKEAHKNLACVYLSKREIEKALKEFRLAGIEKEEDIIRAIKGFSAFSPKDPALYNSLGLFYYHNKNYKKALREYGKAIELRPHAETYYNLVLLYSDLKDYEKAIENYQKAIQAKPEMAQNAEVHYDLGTLYYKLNDNSNAIQEYIKALQINPYYVNAHYKLGNLYYYKNEFSKAITEYELSLIHI